LFAKSISTVGHCVVAPEQDPGKVPQTPRRDWLGIDARLFPGNE